jgi:hypothetical protein
MQLAAVMSSIFLGLTIAAPANLDLTPRCGEVQYPSIIQLLVENFPSHVGPNGNFIKAAQAVGTSPSRSLGSQLRSPANMPEGGDSERTYTFVGFQNIPTGYACQLSIGFPSSIVDPGQTSLNVMTAFPNHPEEIFPNNYSWDSLPAM